MSPEKILFDDREGSFCSLILLLNNLSPTGPQREAVLKLGVSMKAFFPTRTRPEHRGICPRASQAACSVTKFRVPHKLDVSTLDFHCRLPQT